MSIRIYRLSDLTALTGLGRSTVYRMMDEGQFPRPIKLTGKSVGWREADIAAWLDSRPTAV